MRTHNTLHQSRWFHKFLRCSQLNASGDVFLMLSTLCKQLHNIGSVRHDVRNLKISHMFSIRHDARKFQHFFRSVEYVETTITKSMSALVWEEECTFNFLFTSFLFPMRSRTVIVHCVVTVRGKCQGVREEAHLCSELPMTSEKPMRVLKNFNGKTDLTLKPN